MASRDSADIIAAGGSGRVDGAEQVVSIHPMIDLGMAAGGLPAVAAFLLAPHGGCQAEFPAGEGGPTVAVVIMAAIAAVDIDPFWFDDACPCRLIDRRLERVTEFKACQIFKCRYCL